MAKKSKIARNEQRKQTVVKYAEKRRALKKVFSDLKRSPQEREEAYLKFCKLPRDASPIRVVRRCELTGRPHAVYKKFGLSRIALRELALQGELPGVTKASW